MQSLTKGANAPLSGGTVTVQVSCASPVDVSALLLTTAGRVRTDDDMVFYNQPTGPGVGYAPEGVTITFGQVPAEIDKVAVTASLDGSGPAAFGAAGALTARVLDGAGAAVVEFVVDGLSTERAVVCVEVYRRGADWKVRAVGQGYADGLAGIAADFGITVDDAPATAAPPAVAPAGTPADRPSRSSRAGRGLTAPAPPPPAQPPAQTAQPARPAGQGAPAAGYGPPTGPPSNLAPPAARPPAGRVNLDKGRVSLKKRETVSLVKTGAPALRTVQMGLGWDPVKRGGDIDLDASVIAFDKSGRDVEMVWYGNLTGLDGAVKHSGDNLTGEGAGDDELITIALDAVPAKVQVLVFTVNSFQQQKFTEVKNAYCRLLDERGGELVRYDLTDSEARTGVLMSSMTREADGSWSMTALGEFHDGRNVKKMVDPAKAVVQRRH